MSDCCNKCGSITLFKGTNGDYVQVTPEPAGANCDNGGVKIEVISGADNTTVLNTKYVCNGNDISSVAWTSNSAGQPQNTEGTTDTYTITFTDTSTSTFTVYNGADGAPASLSGIASSLSRSVSNQNSTTEQTLQGAAMSGSLEVPANDFVVGDSFMLNSMGFIGVGSTPVDLTIRLKITGATVSTIVIPAKVATNKTWDLKILFTIRSIGASGSVAFAGEFSYEEDASNKHDTYHIQPSFATIDTTILNDLDLTAQWSVADVTNSIDSDLLILTKIK